MISGIYRRTQSSGNDVDPEQDSITLHIADMHGEYTLPTNPPRSPVYGDAHIYTLISFSALEKLMGDGPTEDYLNKHLPQELQDVYGSALVDVWELYGTHDQLVWVFDEFCGKLFEKETGGDDDTFDYWPSAMTVAYQLACDLNRLGILKARYAEYIVNFGEVMEYTPDWED